MATVTVEVNGRPYSVGCADGQECHGNAARTGSERITATQSGRSGS